jgi:PKD repeat protein
MTNLRRWLIALTGSLVVLGVLPATAANAAPVTLTSTADADAYVHESFPTTAHGTTDSQSCQVNDDTPNRRYCYLRFTVSGMQAGDTITSAKVLIRNKGGGGSGRLIKMAVPTTTTWSESTIAWTGRPGFGNLQSTDSTHVFQQDSEFAAPIVTGNGTYDFVLHASSGDLPGAVNFYTKENTVGQLAPRLGVVIDRPATNTPPVANLTGPASTLDDHQVVYDPSGSSDADMDTLTCTFDWDDGTTTGPQACTSTNHTFADPGTYTVEVTVSDGQATDTDTVQTVVGVGTTFGSNYKGVYKSTYAPIKVQRVFFTGAPQVFGAVYTEGDLTDPIHTVVSFKLSPQSVLAGTHDTLLANWAASFPTDRRIDWTFIHEPENQIQNGDFTFAQYRDAFIRIHGIVENNAPAQADHHANLILMAFSLAPSANRDWYNYYPDDDTTRTNGSPYVDVLAWDIYFAGSTDDDKDPGFDLITQDPGRGTPLLVSRDIFAVNAITGDDMGIAEIGYDYDTRRPYILNEIETAFRDVTVGSGPVRYVTYFDLHGTTGPHQLDDITSQQMWAASVAA